MEPITSSSQDVDKVARAGTTATTSSAETSRGITAAKAPQIHETDHTAAVRAPSNLPEAQHDPEHISRQDAPVGETSGAEHPADPPDLPPAFVKVAREMLQQPVRLLHDKIYDVAAFRAMADNVSEKMNRYMEFLSSKGKRELGPAAQATLQEALSTLQHIFDSVVQAQRRITADKPLSGDEVRAWDKSRKVDFLSLSQLSSTSQQLILSGTPDDFVQGLPAAVLAAWAVGLTTTHSACAKDAGEHMQRHTREMRALMGNYQAISSANAGIPEQHRAFAFGKVKDMTTDLKSAIESEVAVADICQKSLFFMVKQTPILRNPAFDQYANTHVLDAVSGKRSLAARMRLVNAEASPLEFALSGMSADTGPLATTGNSILTRFTLLRGQVLQWFNELKTTTSSNFVASRIVFRFISARFEDLALDCRYLRSALPAGSAATPEDKLAREVLSRLAACFDDIKAYLHDTFKMEQRAGPGLIDVAKATALGQAHLEKFFKTPEPAAAPAQPAEALPKPAPQAAEDDSWMTAASTGSAGPVEAARKGRRPTAQAKAASAAAAEKQLKAANGHIADLCDRPIRIDGDIAAARHTFTDMMGVVRGAREHWPSVATVRSVAVGAANRLRDLATQLSDRRATLELWLQEAEKAGQPRESRVGQHEPVSVLDRLSDAIGALQQEEATLRERAESLCREHQRNVWLQHTSSDSFWEIHNSGQLTLERERPGMDEKRLVVFYGMVPEDQGVHITTHVTGADGEPERVEGLVTHGELHWHFDSDDPDALPVSGSFKNALQQGETGALAERGWVHPDDIAELYQLCLDATRDRPALRPARSRASTFEV